ncbi:hypothetical protein POJ06DRAFT_246161 [Lipomyces tetrasporus]|uniref:Uncharacterized protein n=1 Tax=Lipomyces tetrasporus TaxID=54092 RepID=A0AAD7VW38_9ASCO|nr:uncharacterized protein POJ06DRAFT_246161 [Lipomyces tetrasporus]KAJ8102955.1 hypothetical protein POJ06DRAFT_246161 [Lipomyces tetrasporus]
MATKRISKSTETDDSIDRSASRTLPDRHTGVNKGAQSSVPMNQAGRDSKILSHRSQGMRRPTKKLGAKKLSTDMPSFEELEKSAMEEATQIMPPAGRQNVIDTDWMTFASEEKEATTGDLYTWAPQINRTNRTSSTETGTAAGAPRLSFGQTIATPSQMSSESGRSSTDSNTSTRFEHQKCISSDEYFGRNLLDPDQERQLARRLDDFDNAPAISSDEYFGRSEVPPSSEGNDYVERAKDIALRLANNADDEIENVKGYIGRGASKISTAIWNATK